MNDRRATPRKPHFSRVEITAVGSEAAAIRNIAMMEDLSAGGMGLRVQVPLAVGSPIQVSFRGQTLRGVVRHCARNELGYFMGIELGELAEDLSKAEIAPIETVKSGSHRQRRMTARKPHFSRVEISLMGENKKVSRQIAMMEDSSPSGFGLRVHAALPVGSPIEVGFRGQRLVGAVKHCTRDGIGYFVGVQLEQGSTEAIKTGA